MNLINIKKYTYNIIIFQVHKAILKDGSEVAVKIQKPNI